MDSFPWAQVWQLNNVLLEGRWQVLWLMESNFHTMLHGHTAHSCFSMCLHNETLRNRTAGSERAVWKTAFIPGRLLLMTAPVWLWVVVEEVEWRGRLNLQAPPVTMGLGSNLSASISISLTLLQGWKVLWELDRHLPRGHAWMAKGHMAQSSSKFVIRKQHPKVIKGNHCRHVHVDQRKSKPGMMAHVYKPSTRETEAEGLRVGDQLRQ